MDIAVFNFINHWPHFIFTDRFVLCLAILGKYILHVTLFVFAAAFFFKKKSVWQPALFLSFAFVVIKIIVHVLKDMTHRPRPFLVLEHVYRVGQASEGSFPSGHATAFALLGAFMIFSVGKMKPFWLLLIIAAGLGRIYQGVHYPSDILGGWAIGIFTAWIFSAFYKKYYRDSEKER